MTHNLRFYFDVAVAAPARALEAYEAADEAEENWIERLTVATATALGVLAVALLAVLLGLN